MAYGAARSLGLSVAEIETATASFPGLAHRMQEIGRLDGVAFINDSKATNADAAAQGARFLRPDLLDRRRHRQVGRHHFAYVLFPQDRPGLSDRRRRPKNSPATIGDKVPRVDVARSIVPSKRRRMTRSREKRPGAVVLLSPACASFDQYPNFEVRGEAFRKAVAGACRGFQSDKRRGAMLIGRTDRGLLASWWFTVDRLLLTAVLLLMAAGVLISMAASPPVAERLGPRLLPFLQAPARLSRAVRCACCWRLHLHRRDVRRLCSVFCSIWLGLMLAALHVGPEIKGAHRWIELGPVSIQPSEFAKPGFMVVAAWLLAEGRRRPDMPGQILAGRFSPCFHRSPRCCSPISDRPC